MGAKCGSVGVGRAGLPRRGNRSPPSRRSLARKRWASLQLRDTRKHTSPPDARGIPHGHLFGRQWRCTRRGTRRCHQGGTPMPVAARAEGPPGWSYLGPFGRPGNRQASLSATPGRARPRRGGTANRTAPHLRRCPHRQSRHHGTPWQLDDPRARPRPAGTDFGQAAPPLRPRAEPRLGYGGSCRTDCGRPGGQRGDTYPPGSPANNPRLLRIRGTARSGLLHGAQGNPQVGCSLWAAT